MSSNKKLIEKDKPFTRGSIAINGKVYDCESDSSSSSSSRSSDSDDDEGPALRPRKFNDTNISDVIGVRWEEERELKRALQLSLRGDHPGVESGSTNGTNMSDDISTHSASTSSAFTPVSHVAGKLKPKNSNKHNGRSNPKASGCSKCLTTTCYCNYIEMPFPDVVNYFVERMKQNVPEVYGNNYTSPILENFYPKMRALNREKFEQTDEIVNSHHDKLCAKGNDGKVSGRLPSTQSLAYKRPKPTNSSASQVNRSQRMSSVTAISSKKPRLSHRYVNDMQKKLSLQKSQKLVANAKKQSSRQIKPLLCHPRRQRRQHMTSNTVTRCSDNASGSSIQQEISPSTSGSSESGCGSVLRSGRKRQRPTRLADYESPPVSSCGVSSSSRHRRHSSRGSGSGRPHTRLNTGALLAVQWDEGEGTVYVPASNA